LKRKSNAAHFATCVAAPLLAPWAWRFRASCCAADEWHGETFFHQDCTNVPTLGFQRSAIPPVIAGLRPLCSGGAGTGDIFEIEVAGPHTSHVPYSWAASIFGLSRRHQNGPRIKFWGSHWRMQIQVSSPSFRGAGKSVFTDLPASPESITPGGYDEFAARNRRTCGYGFRAPLATLAAPE
jgi:hypothetical protein